MRRLLAHCVGLPVAFALGCQHPGDPEPISFTSIRYESFRPDAGGVEAEPEVDSPDDRESSIAGADASIAYDGGPGAEDASSPDRRGGDGGEREADAGGDEGADGGSEEEPRALPDAA